MKYDLKTVNDYINGNDLEYDIEVLENDKDFMLEVIMNTRDKNFYKLCSEEVKNDYTFVKKLIDEFRLDTKFIMVVTNFYLKYNPDSPERLELLIIMDKLTRNSKFNDKYKMELNCEFMLQKLRLESFLRSPKLSKETKEQLGLGFVYFQELYYDSKLSLDYCARRQINDVFIDYNISLERLLHEKFKFPEELEKMGIYTFMISFIECYDSYLASYLSVNKEILDELVLDITGYMKRWEDFESLNERIKYDRMLDMVHEYMEKNSDNCNLLESELLYYIGKKLGVKDKIFKYDIISKDIFADLINRLDDTYFDSENMSFSDLRHYQNVEKIMIDNLFSKNYVNVIERKKKKSGKIIKL